MTLNKKKDQRLCTIVNSGKSEVKRFGFKWYNMDLLCMIHLRPIPVDEAIQIFVRNILPEPDFFK